MVSLHAQCLSGWAWPWERNFSLDKQVLLFGRWQRSLWLHLHELKSEYTNHFYLHPLLCLTTAEHPSVVRPISLWYHLNLSPSSPCTMSLSIPRPRSRQHNCEHIYYTLESHTFHPPISFYCVAPVFCFNFLGTSNKALISFKEQGGEFVPPSPKFSGRGRGGNTGGLGVWDHHPTAVGEDAHGVFCTIREVAIGFGWLLWNGLVLGCWAALCTLWDGDGGSKDLCWRNSQDSPSQNGW